MEKSSILVVDDSEDIRFLLKSMLRTEGYEVSLANNGQQALSLLQSRKLKPQIVLLDVELPDLSGYDVCAQIQQDSELALIPVIMITGNHHVESQLQAFQLGAVGYLTKPIISDFLLEQVKKAQTVHNNWKSSLSQPDPKQEPRQKPKPTQQTESPVSNPASKPPPLTDIHTHTIPSKPHKPTANEPPPRAKTAPLPPLDESLVYEKAKVSATVTAPLSTPEPVSTPEPKEQSNQLPVPALQAAEVCTLADFLDKILAGQKDQPQGVVTPENLYEQADALGISSANLVQQLSRYTGLPLLEELSPNSIRLGILPLPFCRKYHVIPISTEIDSLAFALTHPFNMEVEDILRPHAQAPRYLIQPEKLEALFTPQKPPITHSAAMTELLAEIQDQYQSPPPVGVKPTPHIPDVEEFTASDDHSSAPVVRLVNRLIEEAHAKGASDIHIEAREEAVLVRYRIDGELRDQHLLKPRALIQALVARLKIMADLNIAEKRLPQDGRIVYSKFTRRVLNFDLRMATAPMNFGEKVVLRLIDKDKVKLSLEELGFAPDNLARYREELKSPYGMILHVGPTGSGKSMTLYSALNELNAPGLNIQTAEDPIEYTLPRINQLQVQPEIGLTFARALKAYLRQDPDVILIGEIRDPETAHTAAEAALTGHLLLSTLHTNDAPSTLTRLLEMGVSPFMLAPSILLICAQRLMRRLCPDCAQPYEASVSEKQLLGLAQTQRQKLFRAQGCARCEQSGYKGRIGIHELLIPTERLRAALTETGMSADRLKQQAVQEGMITLYWDAMRKVCQGITSLEEALHHVKPDSFDSCPPNWMS